MIIKQQLNKSYCLKDAALVYRGDDNGMAPNTSVEYTDSILLIVSTGDDRAQKR